MFVCPCVCKYKQHMWISGFNLVVTEPRWPFITNKSCHYRLSWWKQHLRWCLANFWKYITCLASHSTYLKKAQQNCWKICFCRLFVTSFCLRSIHPGLLSLLETCYSEITGIVMIYCITMHTKWFVFLYGLCWWYWSKWFFFCFYCRNPHTHLHWNALSAFPLLFCLVL